MKHQQNAEKKCKNYQSSKIKENRQQIAEKQARKHESVVLERGRTYLAPHDCLQPILPP
jgi:hypothetical protein